MLLTACDGDLRFDERGSADAAPEVSPDSAGDVDEVVRDDAANGKCTAEADCGLPSLHCDLASGICVACVADQQCTGAFARCDSALNRCVQCGVSADCPPGENCEPNRHRCVRSCADGGACGSSGRCDARGICVECSSTAECARFPDRRNCDVPSGSCVQCANDGECGATHQRCDRVAGTCVQCVSQADCVASKLACDPLTGTCVAP